MAITRPDGTVEYANRHLREMLGIRSDEPVDLPLARFETAMGFGGPDEFRQRPGLSEKGCDEVRILSRSGEPLDVLYAVCPLHDDAGGVTHYVHLLQHLGGGRRLEKLSMLAFHDSLTGLPNRNLFNDRLAHALAVGQRNRTAFALLYIDIDHFKRVNDTFGHETGDELLREVAARLAGSVRASDTVARWGGDEFVALLDGVADQQPAARMASKLLAACGQPYVVRGHECRITLSVGASFYPRDGHDAATLLERADAAMYEVKARGRNGYRIEESPRNYGLTVA
ncbi:MAG: sensor domain-containing diguanylate cyclase [Betaproteobacteria bacterium]|nr:sensor domain-containing diguanylate cyclase [Betaproteobacteria bacterium]